MKTKQLATAVAFALAVTSPKNVAAQGATRPTTQGTTQAPGATRAAPGATQAPPGAAAVPAQAAPKPAPGAPAATVPPHTQGSAAQSAPSPDALQAAADLVAVVAKDMFNQDTAKSWAAVEATIARAKLDKDTLESLRGEFERIQKEKMGDVQRDTYAIYARHFAVPEMRELIAFYRTPTGQKSLQEFPLISAEFVRAVRPRLQEVQAETFLAFRKILADRGFNK